MRVKNVFWALDETRASEPPSNQHERVEERTSGPIMV